MGPEKKVRKSARNIRYYSVAESAVAAEHQGHYEKAETLWLKAAKLAKRQVNADWSEHRSQFCISAIRNGWSQKQS